MPIKPNVIRAIGYLGSNAGYYQRGNHEMRHGTGNLDFPSIAANTTEDLTITVTGVTTGIDWRCFASPRGGTAMTAGLVWSASVTAADTVTVRMANVTVGAIDPAAVWWGVHCYATNP